MVYVAVHVLLASQSEVTVNVTVLTPPHLFGAPVLLLVNTALHPPDLLAVASQVAKSASTSACVLQESSVLLTGQVRTTAGAAVTVKVLLQVCVVEHTSVTVKVTVLEPPHLSGAPVLLLVSTGLQPPETVAVANQLA